VIERGENWDRAFSIIAGDRNMKHVLISLAAILTATGQGFAMDSLSQYSWKNRVLVIFGGAGDPKVRQQVDVIKERPAEMADRDMVVLQVSQDRVTAIYGDVADIDDDLLRVEAEAAGAEFQVVLIGKDGGVKLRSVQVVGDVEMFDLIDRMPMRKAGKS
jgi:hypothetical protein